MARLNAAAAAKPVRTVVGAMTALGIILGAFLAVDGRYASAADFQKQTQYLSTQLEINRLDGELRFLELRRATLEDRLFAVQARPKLTPSERAAMDRDRAETQQLARQIEDKRRLMDRLRTGVKQ